MRVEEGRETGGKDEEELKEEELREQMEPAKKSSLHFRKSVRREHGAEGNRRDLFLCASVKAKIHNYRFVGKRLTSRF